MGRRAGPTGVLLLLAAGLAASCPLGEGMARVFAPGWQPRTGDRVRFWRPHPRWGWAHRPEARGRFVGPGWDVDVHINTKGLRDAERSHERPPGRSRLLLLGDSYAWGYGVEERQALAARLRARCPDWEIVNGAVSGWSTDQEYLFYRDEGRRYEPDAVLLLIHENDLVGNSQDRMYGYPKPRFVARDGKLELENVPVPAPRPSDRVYHWLMARSYLANGVFRATGIALAREVPALAEGRPLVDAKLTARILLRFAAELRREGVAFRWALVPTRPATAAFFERVAREAGVPLLDLSDAFAAAARAGPALHLPGDPHWSARGHHVAAAAIAADLGCAAAPPRPPKPPR